MVVPSGTATGHDEDVIRHDRARLSGGLTGVVLCGGRSTRMGADKASVIFEGGTLLERALARLDTVCSPVFVASGDLELGIPDRRSVADALPGAGPLGGIVAALRGSPHRLVAVAAVDLPWIDTRLMRLLADRIGDSEVAVCETHRGLEPLHAVYATSLLEAAESALASDDRSLRHLIEGSRAVRLRERDWRGAGISDRFSRNINTPEDLADLSRQSPR